MLKKVTKTLWTVVQILVLPLAVLVAAIGIRSHIQELKKIYDAPPLVRTLIANPLPVGTVINTPSIDFSPGAFGAIKVEAPQDLIGKGGRGIPIYLTTSHRGVYLWTTGNEFYYSSLSPKSPESFYGGVWQVAIVRPAIHSHSFEVDFEKNWAEIVFVAIAPFLLIGAGGILAAVRWLALAKRFLGPLFSRIPLGRRL